MTAVDGLTALVHGYRDLIVGAGLAVWSEPGTALPDTGWALIDGRMPPSPSLAVSMTPYVVSDSPRVDDSVLAMNLRIRGDDDPATIRAMSSQLFDLLQGRERFSMGSLAVMLVWRQNSNPIGQDQNDRYEMQDSYYQRVNWPTSGRTF